MAATCHILLLTVLFVVMIFMQLETVNYCLINYLISQTCQFHYHFWITYFKISTSYYTRYWQSFKITTFLL